MNANKFIRAVVAFAFGAIFYFAVASNVSSASAESLQATIQVSKKAVATKTPKAVKAVTKSSERFVESVKPSPPPKPTPVVVAAVPPIKEIDERPKQLEGEAKKKALRAKAIADKAKQEAKDKAKVVVKTAETFESDEARKAKEEKKRKEKEERDRKAKEAAAAEVSRRRASDAPVKSGVIGATFGATGNWSRYHTGLDFRAEAGETVRAVERGRIVYAGNKGNWAGNFVVIKHPDGKKTLYAHMSSISKWSGSVDQGEKIGRVGSTGRAFGAHLHLELYPEGVTPGDVYSAIDPRPWLRDHGIRFS